MLLQPIGLNMMYTMPNMFDMYSFMGAQNSQSLFGAQYFTTSFDSLFPLSIGKLDSNEITTKPMIFNNYQNFGYYPMNYSNPIFSTMPNYSQLSYQNTYPLIQTSYVPFGNLTKKTSKPVLKTDKYENTSKSLNLSDKELDRLGFNTKDLKARWKLLKPEFQKALIKLVKFAEENNIKISYTSTYRTAEEQNALYNKYGSKRAAKPRTSPHEKGIAVDIKATSTGNNKRSNRENQALLGAYWESLGYRWGGHFQNFTVEPWHFDLKPTRS